MRILAVDDDPGILEVLSSSLIAMDNHDVTTAGSAAEGLEILHDERDPFDVLLVDVQMPEMNGIEMCGHIRAIQDYAETPILVVTAMSQRSYIAEAFRNGATDYVTKPFDLIDLRTRVSMAVRQSARAQIEPSLPEVALADPIPMRSVTRLIGHDEYENYVMQVSQSLGSDSSVVAIKILDIKSHHATMEPVSFRSMIETVAHAISALTRQEGHMISYRGNGVFLCIRIGRSDLLPEAFEGILNKQIYASKEGRLATCDLKVVVGQTTMLRATSKAGALDALQSAVASAEQKAEAIVAMPTLSKRVISNQGRSAEEARVEKRAYSLLLQDVLRDEFARPR